jgi:hypothetical protein
VSYPVNGSLGPHFIKAEVNYGSGPGDVCLNGNFAQVSVTY